MVLAARFQSASRMGCLYWCRMRHPRCRSSDVHGFLRTTVLRYGEIVADTSFLFQVKCIQANVNGLCKYLVIVYHKRPTTGSAMQVTTLAMIITSKREVFRDISLHLAVPLQSLPFTGHLPKVYSLL